MPSAPPSLPSPDGSTPPNGNRGVGDEAAVDTEHADLHAVGQPQHPADVLDEHEALPPDLGVVRPAAGSSAASPPAAVAEATAVSLAPGAGSWTSKVAPSEAARHEPPMNTCVGAFATTSGAAWCAVVLRSVQVAMPM